MGLFAAVELVLDHETKAPFPRDLGVVETALAAARERGLLLYPGTGNANGIDGDIVMVGPPFVVTDDQIEEIARGLREAVDRAVAKNV
jgi:adenosylmethionine-8-amino-7-oxononanoate aminotransferase